MNALCLSPVLALATVLLPGASHDAVQDELARVSTLDQIERLRDKDMAVEILFNKDHDEGLLEALAESHPKLETLVLKATGGNRVGQLDALAEFKDLKSLEIRDSLSNLCSLDKQSDTFELQPIGELVQLETLRLHLL